jgi:hypothetical protein
MKSTVSEKPCESKIEYPCLMNDRMKVVLFSSAGTGTVVKILDDDCSFDLGAHGRECFKDGYSLFTGSVCLEND